MSAPAPRRLRAQPGEVIDRTTPVGFRWNRTPMTAFRGDSIVSAISSNGTRILTKSSPFSKARGFATMDAADPHCLVRVDGEPNVRGGQRLISEGMEIESQPQWTPATLSRGSGGRLPSALVSKLSPGPVAPAYRRLRDRLGSGSSGDSMLPPAHFGRRSIHVDVLVIGAGPAGLAAAVAANAEGASVQLVDQRHFLGGHLRWGDEADRGLLAELVDAVTAADGIDVLLGASVVGCFDDGWCAFSQHGTGGDAECLSLVRAGVRVETADLTMATAAFEGADQTAVMSAEAARMLLNLYAVAPGDTAVILGGTSEADAVRDDFLAAGIEVAQFVDPHLGQAISSVVGSKKTLQVTLQDGVSVSADLVVFGAEWAHRSDSAGFGGDWPGALRTGRGILGPPERGVSQHEALVAHGVGTGRLAARRAAVVRHRVRRLTSRAVRPDEPEPSWPEDQRSASDRVELDQSQSGLGLAASLGALASSAAGPIGQGALQAWHGQHGGVQSIIEGRTRTDHYGNPLDEVRNARQGVGVHEIVGLGTLVLSGTDATRLLAAFSKNWLDLAPGHFRLGLVGGRTVTYATAGRLNDDSFLVTAKVADAETLLERMLAWSTQQQSEIDVSVDLVTAGYTNVRVVGPQASELIGRLSDGIVREIPGGQLDRVWLVGVPDCVLMRVDDRPDAFYELHIPSDYGLHVWEKAFELGSDLDVVPLGSRADRILRLESGRLPVTPTPDPPWSPEPTAVVSLVTADPAIVPTESCRVVAPEGSLTVGRVAAAEFSPTFERSVCLAEVGRGSSRPGTPLVVVNPDGERIAVTVGDRTDGGASDA